MFLLYAAPLVLCSKYFVHVPAEELLLSCSFERMKASVWVERESGPDKSFLYQQMAKPQLQRVKKKKQVHQTENVCQASTRRTISISQLDFY